MPVKLIGTMPMGMDLANGYQLEWAAVDPTTGDDVAGVLVSNVGMLVTQLTPGDAEDLQSGPFMLVPGPGTE